jgi:branched-chain amino acid transport system substrate-binding protein
MPKRLSGRLTMLLVSSLLLLAACQPAPAAAPTAAPAKPTEAAKPAASPAGPPAASPGASPAASPAAAQPAAPAPVAKASGELLIGVNLELSGPASVWGQPQLDALNLLADKINARGGANGLQIKLISYDNESNEARSLVVARRLIEEDRVHALIGGGTTPTTMPVVPVANESKVPMVSIGSANAIIEPVGERQWVFKTPSNTRDIVTRMLKHLDDNRLTRIGFLSVNNAYGDAGRSEMEKAAEGAGITVTAYEKFGATDSDMKPQLTRVRAGNPDAIVVWAIPPAASILDKNYKELNLTIPLIHDHGASSYVYQELAGDAAEGSTIISVKSMVPDQLPDSDPVKAVASEYVREYQARYSRKAGGVDAMTHDALLLIARAAETAGADRARLRDALESLQNVVGATGVFNLSPRDHNGLSEKDLVVAQIKGGQWMLLQP